MLIEIEKDNLAEIVERESKVVVQYSAGWCGNCRIMKPKFKKMARDLDEVSFVIVDAEKNPESRKLATVDNLPTFAVFKNGSFINQLQTNKFDNLQNLVNEITDN